MSLEKKIHEINLSSPVPPKPTPSPDPETQKKTQNTKSLFEEITKKIVEQKSKPSPAQLSEKLTEIQSKLPQPKRGGGLANTISDVEIEVPVSGPTPPPTEIEITPTKIRCRQCKKEKPVSEFKSEASGKIIKTCNICQGRSSIKNPRLDPTPKPKSMLSKVLENVDELEKQETFDRQKLIKIITDAKYPQPELLQGMTDDELRGLRKNLFEKALKKFEKSEVFLFEVGLGFTSVIENVFSTDDFDLKGLREEFQQDRDQWLQIIKDLLEESPELLINMSPKHRIFFLAAKSFINVSVQNKKKKAGSMNDGGQQ